MGVRGPAAVWIWGPCICVLVCASLFGQNSLQAKAQQARQRMIEGRYDEAVRLYADLVRELPNNPGMLLNLGIAQQSAGQYPNAIASLSAALKLDPSLTNAKLMLGLVYQKLGEPGKAVRPLSAVVAEEPGNQITRWELANAQLAANGFQDAAQQFQRLTKIDPTNPRYWQGLGFSYLGLAKRSFAALEKVAPDSPYVYALLARSQDERQQGRSAFTLYRKALQEHPDFPGVHVALAEIYLRTGHPQWAAIEEQRERTLPAADCSSVPVQCAFQNRDYEKVLQSPDTPQNLYWKDRTYSEMARDALAHLDQLPPSPQVYELMAEAFRLQGEHTEAADELRKALKLDPASLDLRTELATELWLGRDWAAAGPALERLLATAPNSAELNYELGDTLLQQQEAGKALPLLEKAVRLKPDLLEAEASLARALVDCGRPATAIPRFQAALPLDRDGHIHFELYRAAQQAGKLALAKEALRQFQIMSHASAARNKLTNKEEITAPN
jgi:tetratricopeptide (TPR) repeat protein